MRGLGAVLLLSFASHVYAESAMSCLTTSMLCSDRCESMSCLQSCQTAFDRCMEAVQKSDSSYEYQPPASEPPPRPTYRSPSPSSSGSSSSRDSSSAPGYSGSSQYGGSTGSTSSSSTRAFTNPKSNTGKDCIKPEKLPAEYGPAANDAHCETGSTSTFNCKDVFFNVEFRNVCSAPMFVRWDFDGPRREQGSYLQPGESTKASCAKNRDRCTGAFSYSWRLSN